MPINFISNVDSLRYAQLYRLQELLRLDHNANGLKYNLGVISKKDWEDYKTLYFEPMEREIIIELLYYRDKIKNDHTINTNLNDVII